MHIDETHKKALQSAYKDLYKICNQRGFNLNSEKYKRAIYPITSTLSQLDPMMKDPFSNGIQTLLDKYNTADNFKKNTVVEIGKIIQEHGIQVQNKSGKGFLSFFSRAKNTQPFKTEESVPTPTSTTDKKYTTRKF